MTDFAKARRMMVDCQLRTFDVTDIDVLAAFDAVPRERFVPDDRLALAYSDTAVRAGGRAMLAPMVLARMIQAASVRPGERALTVGGGTGYGAAVLARLGATVVALESDSSLAERARDALAGSAMVVEGKLEAGHAAAAPYDVILIEGAVEVQPDALLGQLADGGRLLCIDAATKPGRATIYVRARDQVGSRRLFDAAAPVLDGFAREDAFVF